VTSSVALAVITSASGVLLGHRADGNPPWTFPGGKIRPDETAEAAAVREALEETGLSVAADRVIGSRPHPVTGYLAVYVACPFSGGEPRAVRPWELAEVRWASLAEVGELMAGTIFEPVRAYLALALR
jgi:8-oxo-dGTP diphosphatase